MLRTKTLRAATAAALMFTCVTAAGCAGEPPAPGMPSRAALKLGEMTGDYTLHEDKLCNGAAAARRVVVDVDGTTVYGNFIFGFKLWPEARDALKQIDSDFGVIYLTANFKAHDIDKYFADNGYPVAPLYARPLPLINGDYDAWCKQAEDYLVCDYVYKIGQIKFMRDQCKFPERVLGIGDRYIDYTSYVDTGICPIIVDNPKATGESDEWIKKGCAPGGSGDYYYWNSETYRGRRCPVVPARNIVPWPQVPRIAKQYLNGEVACGEWKLDAAPASGAAAVAPAAPPPAAK